MAKTDRHTVPHTAGKLGDKVFVDDGVMLAKITPNRSWTMSNCDLGGFLSPLWLRANTSIGRLQGGGRPAPWDHNMEPEEQ